MPDQRDRQATGPPAGTIAPERDPWAGRRLGRYVLTRRLGRGSMGVVYEAQDTALRRAVAVKLLAAAAAERDTLKRFFREARATARLSHPNVVAVHGVEQHAGVTFIVMELVPGGTVQDRLRESGPFPWPEATRITAAVCRGLAAAHAAGVIHRDIKPANILLTACGLAGSPKLADFGLAKRLDRAGASLTGPGAVLGTPDYMSPEQCNGEPADVRSDVYALGATYHALLTGRPPYPHELPVQVMFAHCSAPVPDPRAVNAEVPAECAAVVARAMAKNPAARYQTAAELLADLDSLFAVGPAPEGPVELPPAFPDMGGAATLLVTPPPAVARRRKRQFRWAVPAVAVLAVGLFLGAWAARNAAPPTATAEPPRKPEPTAVGPAPAPERPRPRPAEPARAGPVEPARAGPVEPNQVISFNGRVEAVAFSPDGKLLATGCTSGGGGVQVREWATGRELYTRWFGQGIRAVAFSPDNRLLAAASADGGGVFVWKALTGDRHAQFSTGDARITSLGFAADYRLAVGFEVKSGRPNQLFLQFFDLGGTREPRRFGATGVDGECWVVGPVEGSLVAVRPPTGKFALWGPANGPERGAVDIPGPLAGLATSATGQTVAAAGPDGIQLWDLASGTTRGRATNPLGRPTCLALSLDGRTLAVGTGSSGDWGAVTVWQTSPLRLVQVLRDPGGVVCAMAFSADGHTLAAGCADRTLRTWEVAKLR
jgi:hypothetical protein